MVGSVGMLRWQADVAGRGGRLNGMLDCLERHNHILETARRQVAQVMNSEKTPLLTCLLEGDSGRWAEGVLVLWCSSIIAQSYFCTDRVSCVFGAAASQLWPLRWLWKAGFRSSNW